MQYRGAVPAAAVPPLLEFPREMLLAQLVTNHHSERAAIVGGMPQLQE